MAWIASEGCYEYKFKDRPERICSRYHSIGAYIWVDIKNLHEIEKYGETIKVDDRVSLPMGTIEKLIGRKLSIDDDPVEIDDDLIEVKSI